MCHVTPKEALGGCAEHLGSVPGSASLWDPGSRAAQGGHEDPEQVLGSWCLVQSRAGQSLPSVFVSFPQSVYSPVPILRVKDPIDRPIEFVPTKTPYDPRWMLAGRPNPSTYIFGAGIRSGAFCFKVTCQGFVSAIQIHFSAYQVTISIQLNKIF